MPGYTANMAHRHSWHALGALVFSLGSLTAQRVFVVAAGGGTGVDFTDVPPAISAANDGDVILVRPGTYSAADINNKAISLLGTSGVTLTGLRVHDLAPSRSVTVSDLMVFANFTLLFPGASDCVGRVLFERVSFGQSNSSSPGVRPLFQNNADLRFSSCRFPALASIAGSLTTMTDCSLVPPSFNLTGTSLAQSGGTTVMSRCTVIGQSELGRVSPTAAISLNGGTLYLTDDGSNRIAAGTATTVQQPAAIVGSGAVIRDPRVVVVAGSAPPIAGPSDTIRAIPTLRALGAPVGGNVELDLSGAPGQVFALVIGLPGTPLQLPALGGYVGLGTLAVVAQGVFGANPHRMSIPVSAGLPQGFQIAWQAVALDALGNGQLSNVATYARPQ